MWRVFLPYHMTKRVAPWGYPFCHIKVLKGSQGKLLSGKFPLHILFHHNRMISAVAGLICKTVKPSDLA